jgi:hypothetical protein
MRIDWCTNLLCGSANEDWGSFEAGDEDGHKLLQKSRVYVACNVVLKVVAQLSRRVDFDFHIYG